MRTSRVDADRFTCVFPNIVEQARDVVRNADNAGAFFSERAILCPKNVDVDTFNMEAMSKFPTADRTTYYSEDTLDAATKKRT